MAIYTQPFADPTWGLENHIKSPFSLGKSSTNELFFSIAMTSLTCSQLELRVKAEEFCQFQTWRRIQVVSELFNARTNRLTPQDQSGRMQFKRRSVSIFFTPGTLTLFGSFLCFVVIIMIKTTKFRKTEKQKNKQHTPFFDSFFFQTKHSDLQQRRSPRLGSWTLPALAWPIATPKWPCLGVFGWIYQRSLAVINIY